MVRSKRLTSIARIAQSRERDAARLLAARQERLSGQQSRLAELKVYREDYFQRLRSGPGRDQGAGRLREYQRFLSQLDAAIAQLESQLEESRADVEASRQAWLQRHSRTQALDKVVARSRDQERYVEARREQAESDERAQRRRNGD